jgi:hypothetical protein
MICNGVFHRVYQCGKQSETARMSAHKARDSGDTRNSGEGSLEKGAIEYFDIWIENPKIYMWQVNHNRMS